MQMLNTFNHNNHNDLKRETYSQKERYIANANGQNTTIQTQLLTPASEEPTYLCWAFN